MQPQPELCLQDRSWPEMDRSWTRRGSEMGGPLTQTSSPQKGVGRGLHQTGVICSQVGWLADVSQTLEYGKNYDSYWTGELFVKQVS